jgi:hypothetical protein
MLQRLFILVRLGESLLIYCHSKPVLSARNLLLPTKTADFSRDTAALQNDNS